MEEEKKDIKQEARNETGVEKGPEPKVAPTAYYYHPIDP